MGVLMQLYTQGMLNIGCTDSVLYHVKMTLVCASFEKDIHVVYGNGHTGAFGIVFAGIYDW
jgi:hypothetical protein